MKAGKCRSCGARVVWAVTEHGRRMPLDAEPVAGGTFTLTTSRGELVATSTPGVELGYVSHFATCPQAGAWRR